jgi:hypothetical protein
MKINYWGKTPWNALMAMSVEKSRERTYHAGYARQTIERAAHDEIALETAAKFIQICRIKTPKLKFAEWDTGACLTMCWDRTQETIHYSRGCRRLLRYVEERAPIWLEGNYPITDGLIEPRDERLMEKQGVRIETKLEMWNRIYLSEDEQAEIDRLKMEWLQAS